jgi:hypothetical protein
MARMDQDRHSRTKKPCSGENASGKNCSEVKADRRCNSGEGFYARGFPGFPCLEEIGTTASLHLPASAVQECRTKHHRTC